MKYYQLTMDLTNEWDVENCIKDCDVVINLIGEKPVVKHDYNFEEPNVLIPRTIAKVCARMEKESKVKRLIHFSAAGCNPDAISRRLRTKWQGEQEVMKYFPEATIIRPTTIISDGNSGNFINYYLHCWMNNNGTVLLLDDGKCLRQPVLDDDISLAVFNMLQLDNSKGSIYELGGLHQYNMKELMEFFSNSLNHRPRFVTTTYEDFMKLNLSPNLNFEKAVNWLVARPDYSSELRTDIIVNKRDGVKTFEDLHIIPVGTHHILTDLGNWYLERLSTESYVVRDHDEHDADDDAHH
jgi:nucleoside-diphosphate-sugar epimerase